MGQKIICWFRHFVGCELERQQSTPCFANKDKPRKLIGSSPRRDSVNHGGFYLTLINKSDHPERGWLTKMKKCTGYGIPNHFRSNARPLIPKSRAYPCASPIVLYILCVRPGGYPKGLARVRFCVEYKASSRRNELGSSWLLAVIVSVSNLASFGVSSVG